VRGAGGGFGAAAPAVLRGGGFGALVGGPAARAVPGGGDGFGAAAGGLGAAGDLGAGAGTRDPS
jgi:hypothetical protein